MGYSFRLTARVLLYASSHRQDNTYHGLCYTSRGALAGTRNSSCYRTHTRYCDWEWPFCKAVSETLAHFFKSLQNILKRECSYMKYISVVPDIPLKKYWYQIIILNSILCIVTVTGLNLIKDCSDTEVLLNKVMRRYHYITESSCNH